MAYISLILLRDSMKAYLELKGSLVTKGNKIKGLAPTLYKTRNTRRLVHNPNDILSPYHHYKLICGFAHPDQECIYCYKGNRKLFAQYCRLPDCHGFQMNPTHRVGSLSAKYVEITSVHSMFFLLLNLLFLVPFSSARDATKKPR
jgi:hypothetical protein